MSVEELTAMTPYTTRGSDYVNLAAEAARKLFITHIKNQPATRSVFFRSNQSDPREGQIHTSFDFNKVAAAYVSKAISMTNGYGFAQAINVGAVDGFLQSIYESKEWVQLGYHLYSITFPDAVKCGKKSFRGYMTPESDKWGNALFNTVTTEPWMNTMVQKYINNLWPHYNEDINVILFMIHLLDDSLVDKAFDILKNGIPKSMNVFKNTNYLGGPMDPGDILSTVQQAINNVTKVNHYSHAGVSGGTGSYVSSVTSTWGADVAAYIFSQSQPYGFFSGNRPSNSKTDSTSPCIIA